MSAAVYGISGKATVPSASLAAVLITSPFAPRSSKVNWPAWRAAPVRAFVAWRRTSPSAS